MPTHTDHAQPHRPLAPLRALAGWMLVATAYCWGLWKHLWEFGVGDWDYALLYSGVPWRTVLEYGQFPFWNPYYCGGARFFAHPHSAFLTPMFAFELLWGPIAGLRLEIWAHLVVGLVGMHVVAVTIHGLRRWHAVLPAVIFMLSGNYAFHTAQGHWNWMAVAYWPWVYFSYHRALSDRRYLPLAAFLLALMIFEGATYVTVHAGLFLAVLGLFVAVQRAQWRPLVVAAAILALAPLLAAVKLVPMLQFLSESPRYIDSPETTSLYLIFTALFSHDQSNLLRLSGQYYGWWEYANYIGILSGLLSLVGLAAAWRTYWPLFGTGIFMLQLTGGAWSTVAPWSLLRQLPVFDSFHVPSRFLYGLVFSLSLFAGIGLSRVCHKRPRFRVAMYIVFALIIADLFVVNSPVFDSTAAGAIVAPDRAPAFVQVTGDKLRMFDTFLSNRGTLDCYEMLPFARQAIPADASEYRGEVFRTGEGTATLMSWSPNRVVVAVSGAGELTLNQNYAAGWKTEEGLPVYNHRGLITTRIAPSDRVVTLYYQPPLFAWALVISCGAVLGSLYLMFSARFRQSRPSLPTGR